MQHVPEPPGLGPAPERPTPASILHPPGPEPLTLAVPATPARHVFEDPRFSTLTPQGLAQAAFAHLERVRARAADRRAVRAPTRLIVLFALLVLVGGATVGTPTVTAAPEPAGRDPARSSPSGSTLLATPNPVPAGPGPGTTTITWSVAEGAPGQVYVSVDGGPETLVAEGLEGSHETPGISPGATYEFRLYAGTERALLLATTTVTRQ